MKKRKWILLVLLMLTGLALVSVMKNQLIPEMLRNSRNEDVKALRFEVNDAKAVVFYPKDIEAEFSKNMAQFIKNDLIETSVQSENVKVDFK